jgi:flagellar hook-associated protein 3 FlgL
MKTSAISTSALSDSMRSAVAKLQARLAEAQKEVTTGRHADVGRVLGARTGEVISLRQEHVRLQTITETNGLVAARLDGAQAALEGLAQTAQTFLGHLMAARSGGENQKVLQTEAKSALSVFTESLNTALNGASLFAGINADIRPIADYAAPGAANAQAVADAFSSAFGVAQSDPSVAGISAEDMQSFLDTTFADLFEPGAWSGTWSTASDQNVRSRISSTELIQTSVNANDAAFRKLASAFTMVADLGAADLNQNAFQTVVDTATRAVAEAIDGLTGLQADLGIAQERLIKANDRMAIQVDIMTNHIGILEGVDPYEASSRVASLLTQVETAYAMTARIQSLSILNYLR